MILFNDSPIEITHFPNGEALIRKDSILTNKKEDGNKLTLLYESDADLLNLLLIRKALWFPCDLHIPYFPYSRMDRNSDSYVFTLKSVCKYINWLEFANVYIYEPHSDVTPALLNHCKIVDLIPQLLSKARFDSMNASVMFPDAGAYKKYSGIVAANEIIGIKKRDFKTGKIIHMEIVGEVRGGNTVFIIDDLCSKGGTFIMAAEKLRAIGFSKVYLVVAHCEKTIFDGQIFKSDAISHVYTTNTLLPLETNEPRLTIFDYTSLKP